MIQINRRELESLLFAKIDRRLDPTHTRQQEREREKEKREGDKETTYPKSTGSINVGGFTRVARDDDIYFSLGSEKGSKRKITI